MESLGAQISGVATAINYGTATVSLMMLNPIFTAIAAPISAICTLLSTSAGIADSSRIGRDLEYSKILAKRAIDDCINMSFLSACMATNMVYACFEIVQPKNDDNAWENYELNYKGKRDAKARELGYATRDKLITDGKKNTYALGLGYSYSISMIDRSITLQRLNNFNDNMKNIRISGKDGFGNFIPPKTISEGERMEEFKDIKDLKELISYMHKKTKNNEYYLYALGIVGLDGSSQNGTITFDMGNGQEKIIHESGTIGLRELFSINYRTYYIGE